MELSKLYGKYFQKSRNFLYPLLGIKRTSNISPVNTFVSWEGLYTEEDRKLIVLYKQEDTEGYRAFEKMVLFTNRYFVDFKECEGGYTAYVFTFEHNKEDWDKFLLGQYSKLSSDLKTKIKQHYGEKSPEWKYLDSYLNPSKFLEKYTELLIVDPTDYTIMYNLLQRVGELCDPYNKDKERLKIGIKHLELLHELS